MNERLADVEQTPSAAQERAKDRHEKNSSNEGLSDYLCKKRIIMVIKIKRRKHFEFQVKGVKEASLHNNLAKAH